MLDAAASQSSSSRCSAHAPTITLSSRKARCAKTKDAMVCISIASSASAEEYKRTGGDALPKICERGMQSRRPDWCWHRLLGQPGMRLSLWIFRCPSMKWRSSGRSRCDWLSLTRANPNAEVEAVIIVVKRDTMLYARRRETSCTKPK